MRHRPVPLRERADDCPRLRRGCYRLRFSPGFRVKPGMTAGKGRAFHPRTRLPGSRIKCGMTARCAGCAVAPFVLLCLPTKNNPPRREAFPCGEGLSYKGGLPLFHHCFAHLLFGADDIDARGQVDGACRTAVNQHAARVTGQADRNVVGQVVGRFAHGDGNGVRLPVFDAAAAGVT